MEIIIFFIAFIIISLKFYIYIKCYLQLVEFYSLRVQRRREPLTKSSMRVTVMRKKGC